MHSFFIGANLSGHAEVTDLDAARLIKQNVIKLDVSVDHKLFGMDIMKTLDQLFE